MTSTPFGLVVQQHQQALDENQAHAGLLDGLSPQARQVLRDVSAGRGTHFNCSGRSAHGGRSSLLLALRKRGLLDLAGGLTDAGRAAVAQLQAPGKEGKQA